MLDNWALTEDPNFLDRSGIDDLTTTCDHFLVLDDCVDAVTVFGQDHDLLTIAQGWDDPRIKGGRDWIGARRVALSVAAHGWLPPL
jgi:hypothetical protein